MIVKDQEINKSCYRKDEPLFVFYDKDLNIVSSWDSIILKDIVSA
jgi:hypothetical protein